MGFIGKIFKNKQIVTIVALILCFGILVFAYRYRVNKAISAVSVPIATRDLQARELIQEDCFETKKVAASMLTENVITNENDLLGDEEKNIPSKYVNYNTFIPEGSMFYRSAVTTWDHMPDSAWSDIEEGFTIISLAVDADSTYGNSIFPKNKIDLYFTARDESGNVFVGPLIVGKEVLAVKDEDGSHIFKKSPNQKNASALIFEVTEEDFLLLKRAENTSGEIFPVPRNAEYSKEAEEQKTSSYIIDYINKHSKRTNDITSSKTSVNKVTE